MTDVVSEPTQALILRPQVLPSTAQFEIERNLAWRLRNARGFLPNHFLIGPDEERAAKILAAIEYGRAVGIEPMIALQNLQLIDGKVGASALLIGAQLRKAGYDPLTSWFKVDRTPCEESDPELFGCKVVVVRVRDSVATGDGSFSFDDATRAGLVKPQSGYQKFPRDMYYARALTAAARRGAQDAVLGMAYTAEELGGQVDEEALAGLGSLPSSPKSDPIIDAEVITPEPGVQEATKDSPPTGAAIQPAPPAPVADPIPPASVPPVEPTQEPAPPSPPGPNAMPVAPLAGANVSRRLGVGRSISPVRRNVVAVQPTQAAEAPVTAPEAVPTATAPPESVLDQPAPSALTDEPDLPAMPEPEDPGKREYLNQQRQLLRESTATLFRVNAIIENVKLGMDGKEPKPLPVPSANEGSDKALADRINADWPGRTLANLGEAELASLMERFESSLVKKRDWMKERGISEE